MTTNQCNDLIARHVGMMNKYLDWLNSLKLSYYERTTLLSLAEQHQTAISGLKQLSINQ